MPSESRSFSVPRFCTGSSFSLFFAGFRGFDWVSLAEWYRPRNILSPTRYLNKPPSLFGDIFLLARPLRAIPRYLSIGALVPFVAEQRPGYFN